MDAWVEVLLFRLGWKPISAPSPPPPSGPPPPPPIPARFTQPNEPQFSQEQKDYLGALKKMDVVPKLVPPQAPEVKTESKLSLEDKQTLETLLSKIDMNQLGSVTTTELASDLNRQCQDFLAVCKEKNATPGDFSKDQVEKILKEHQATLSVQFSQLRSFYEDLKAKRTLITKDVRIYILEIGQMVLNLYLVLQAIHATNDPAIILKYKNGIAGFQTYFSIIKEELESALENDTFLGGPNKNLPPEERARLIGLWYDFPSIPNLLVIPTHMKTWIADLKKQNADWKIPSQDYGLNFDRISGRRVRSKKKVEYKTAMLKSERMQNPSGALFLFTYKDSTINEDMITYFKDDMWKTWEKLPDWFGTFPKSFETVQTDSFHPITKGKTSVLFHSIYQIYIIAACLKDEKKVAMEHFNCALAWCLGTANSRLVNNADGSSRPSQNSATISVGGKSWKLFSVAGTRNAPSMATTTGFKDLQTIGCVSLIMLLGVIFSQPIKSLLYLDSNLASQDWTIQVVCQEQKKDLFVPQAWCVIVNNTEKKCIDLPMMGRINQEAMLVLLHSVALINMSNDTGNFSDVTRTVPHPKSLDLSTWGFVPGATRSTDEDNKTHNFSRVPFLIMGVSDPEQTLLDGAFELSTDPRLTAALVVLCNQSKALDFLWRDQLVNRDSWEKEDLEYNTQERIPMAKLEATERIKSGFEDTGKLHQEQANLEHFMESDEKALLFRVTEEQIEELLRKKADLNKEIEVLRRKPTDRAFLNHSIESRKEITDEIKQKNHAMEILRKDLRPQMERLNELQKGMSMITELERSRESIRSIEEALSSSVTDLDRQINTGQLTKAKKTQEEIVNKLLAWNDIKISVPTATKNLNLDVFNFLVSSNKFGFRHQMATKMMERVQVFVRSCLIREFRRTKEHMGSLYMILQFLISTVSSSLSNFRTLETQLLSMFPFVKIDISPVSLPSVDWDNLDIQMGLTFADPDKYALEDPTSKTRIFLQTDQVTIKMVMANRTFVKQYCEL